MKDAFADFVVEQLAALDDVDCRPMFGGHGLYQDEVFFAIVFKSRLYFKTNEESAVRYRKLGMKPFRPNTRQTLKNYYEVPADVIEDRDRLADWAADAVAAARDRSASKRR